MTIYSSGINQALSSSSTQASSQVERNNEDSSLGKNAFFELLTTQLKHQDPLKPMDNTQFISQMAEFSSLEQMNNMNQNMKQFLQIQGVSEGSTLIGKTIETVDSDTGKMISGEVKKVGFESGEMYAYLKDDTRVPVGGISAIY